MDVAVKADGSVLVLDRAEKEIQHFDSLGNHLRTIDLVSILGPGISDPTRFAVTQNDVIALVDAGTSKVVLFELPRIVTDAPPNTTTSTLAVAVDTSMLGASSMRFSVSGLAEHRPFEVGVFDIRGRLVRMMHADTPRAGRVFMAWDMTDSRGSAVASGVYFVRVSQAGSHAVAKTVVLK
ncbi:hypothetical protein DRQ32_12490 [bacterium]|nr:MAG: hypothetical protein DRQ32_12490 [bacterium]